jgi:hypothetical protein
MVWPLPWIIRDKAAKTKTLPSTGTIRAPAGKRKREVWANLAFFMVDDTGLEPVTSGM